MKYNEEDTIFDNGKNMSNDEDTIVANDANKINDEETIVDQEKVKDSKSEDQDQHDTSSESVEKEKKSDINWKQVAATGATAVVMGAAGVLLTSFVNANVNIKEEGKTDNNGRETNHSGSNKPEPAQHSETEQESSSAENVAHVRVEGLPVSHNVTDDMSFDEAFATARQEVGPGGVFEWHGGVYGTYYASEWNSMSDEEQAEFGSHISYRADSSIEQPTTTVTAEDPSEEEIEQEVEVVHSGDSYTGNTEAEEAPVEVEDTSNVEVELIGHEVVTLEDGSQVDMGYMEVDGHNAVVIDVDVDGTYDVLGVDVNGNGVLESNEVADIHEEGITTDFFDQMGSANDLYAELPDYTNDADPSSFA